MEAAGFPTLTTESLERLKGALREPRGFVNTYECGTLPGEEKDAFPFIYYPHDDPCRNAQEINAQIYWEARWNEEPKPHDDSTTLSAANTVLGKKELPRLPLDHSEKSPSGVTLGGWSEL